MNPFLRVILIVLLPFSFVQKLDAMGKDSVLLRGLVYNDKNRVKNVEVNVFKDNELIKKVKAKTNRFRTYLPTHSKLTITISSEGYHTKSFIFDTNLPSNVAKIPDYSFDIDIFKEEELEGINTSFLDFPVGLVSYNEKKQEFIRNKKYSKQMKKAYLKLWGEAQSKAQERAGFDDSEE